MAVKTLFGLGSSRSSNCEKYCPLDCWIHDNSCNVGSHSIELVKVLEKFYIARIKRRHHKGIGNILFNIRLIMLQPKNPSMARHLQECIVFLRSAFLTSWKARRQSRISISINLHHSAYQHQDLFRRYVFGDSILGPLEHLSKHCIPRVPPCHVIFPEQQLTYR